MDQDKRPNEIEKLLQQPSHFEMEYVQVNESIRAIWPTFFSLASMTFAWNASMGTGYAILMYYGTNVLNGDESANLFGVPWFAIVCSIISLVAIVYNWGARKAYALMTDSIDILASELEKFKSVDGLLIPSRLASFVSKKNVSKRGLGAFTHFFFMLLMLIWLVVLALTLLLLFRDVISIGGA